MPKYIEEKELREWVQNWFEKNRYYHPYSKSNNIPIPELYDILEQMPSADEEKVATEYCMKRCLVMMTMDTYEKLIACYNRCAGLRDERRDDD